MPYYGNAIKLHTWSDSFRYLKQRKGGSVRPLGGFTWLPIDKKASSFSSKNLRNFFSRVVFLPNETWYM